MIQHSRPGSPPREEGSCFYRLRRDPFSLYASAPSQGSVTGILPFFCCVSRRLASTGSRMGEVAVEGSKARSSCNDLTLIYMIGIGRHAGWSGNIRSSPGKNPTLYDHMTARFFIGYPFFPIIDKRFSMRHLAPLLYLVELEENISRPACFGRVQITLSALRTKERSCPPTNGEERFQDDFVPKKITVICRRKNPALSQEEFDYENSPPFPNPPPTPPSKEGVRGAFLLPKWIDEDSLDWEMRASLLLILVSNLLHPDPLRASSLLGCIERSYIPPLRISKISPSIKRRGLLLLRAGAPDAGYEVTRNRTEGLYVGWVLLHRPVSRAGHGIDRRRLLLFHLCSALHDLQGIRETKFSTNRGERLSNDSVPPSGVHTNE
eukprot:Gb_36625 [translate_table: standard]